MEKATFGAGCFWGVEEAFRRIKGVISTVVGYAGGKTENPTYKEVCTDKTGHAEVIQIEFDPSKITFDDLLAVFFQIHDPTTKNRQGPDVGSQYRSVIFYHSKKQEESARAYKEQLELSGRFDGPIVTEILPAGPFYLAEEYHQKYHEKHGGSCQM
jgi:peptide-methionine (S)-S-oxide reductase